MVQGNLSGDSAHAPKRVWATLCLNRSLPLCCCHRSARACVFVVSGRGRAPAALIVCISTKPDLIAVSLELIHNHVNSPLSMSASDSQSTDKPQANPLLSDGTVACADASDP